MFSTGNNTYVAYQSVCAYVRVCALVYGAWRNARMIPGSSVCALFSSAGFFSGSWACRLPFMLFKTSSTSVWSSSFANPSRSTSLILLAWDHIRWVCVYVRSCLLTFLHESLYLHLHESSYSWSYACKCMPARVLSMKLCSHYPAIPSRGPRTN